MDVAYYLRKRFSRRRCLTCSIGWPRWLVKRHLQRRARRMA